MHVFIMSNKPIDLVVVGTQIEGCLCVCVCVCLYPSKVLLKQLWHQREFDRINCL